MTPERLAFALFAQAEGSYTAEASVGLLVEHGSWLARADFVRFVDVAASFGNDRVVMAWVDWEAALAAELAASSSEIQMLAVAAELAGVDTGRTLQDLLGGLDRTNTTLVIRAVLHAQRGADASPLTVTPFPPARRSPHARITFGPREPPAADAWSEPEGLGL